MFGGGRNIYACVYHFVRDTLEMSHIDEGALQSAVMKSVGVVFAATRLFT